MLCFAPRHIVPGSTVESAFMAGILGHFIPLLGQKMDHSAFSKQRQNVCYFYLFVVVPGFSHWAGLMSVMWQTWWEYGLYLDRGVEGDEPRPSHEPIESPRPLGD